MRLAVASSSHLALPTIAALRSADHQIVGFLTKPDSPRGRGKVLAQSDLAQALDTDLPIYKPSDDLGLIKALAVLNPDLVVTIAYGRLIKAPALTLPRYGWINLHFSLLPKYRGAAPVQWAIRNGELVTGVSVFQLDTGMDTGPIFITRSRQMRGNETSGELLAELSEVGAEAVVAAVQLIQQGKSPTPQPEAGTLAPKIKKVDAKLDWQLPAVELERIVRAMNPQPGAWANFRGSRIQIHSASPLPGTFPLPGSICNLDPLSIACGSGALAIGSLQQEGKRVMQAAEWLRGARLGLDERFE